MPPHNDMCRKIDYHIAPMLKNRNGHNFACPTGLESNFWWSLVSNLPAETAETCQHCVGSGFASPFPSRHSTCEKSQWISRPGDGDADA